MKLKIDFPISGTSFNSTWPKFFMMGSCFAENQAIRMAGLCFYVHSNPFGIVYNPKTISSLISRIAEEKLYDENDFHFYNDRYFSLNHHGSFKFNSIQEAVKKSNQQLADSSKQLKDAEVIVLTFGTSLVFKHKETESVVGNCHKIPNKEFNQEQLSVAETSFAIHGCVDSIRSVNTNAHIIITVSPVRHLRSGVVENSLSKSTLISATHAMVNSTENVSYFPSYEIFIDELRDYRFAKEDMMHPNQQAEEYIWNRFVEAYFSQKSKETLAEIKKVIAFENHIPRGNNDKHKVKLLMLKKDLLQRYPFINLNV